MTKYKAILFDLDGTLLDTLLDLANGVNYVMRKYNQPEHSVEAVRSYVGNGVRNLMRRAVPGGEDNPTFEAQLTDDIEYYRGHDRIHTKPYDGIPEMLDALRERGMSIAVLSNKDEVAVKNLCEHFFKGHYDLALGNTKDRPRKPDPAIVKAAFELFGVKPGEVLYVGDSETDAKTAEAAGVDYILVSWGFRDRETLSKYHAKQIIDSPKELLAFCHDSDGAAA